MEQTNEEMFADLPPVMKDMALILCSMVNREMVDEAATDIVDMEDEHPEAYAAIKTGLEIALVMKVVQVLAQMAGMTPNAIHTGPVH